MRENRITEINYSPQVQGFFCCAVFGVTAIGLKITELSVFGQSRLNPMLQGRLYDTMSIPVIAPLNKALWNDDLSQGQNILVSSIFPILNEICEGLGVAKGTFDWGDFVAFGAGSLLWLAYDSSAKKLHDSGLTLPIYRALNIRHQVYG